MTQTKTKYFVAVCLLNIGLNYKNVVSFLQMYLLFQTIYLCIYITVTAADFDNLSISTCVAIKVMAYNPDYDNLILEVHSCLYKVYHIFFMLTWLTAYTVCLLIVCLHFNSDISFLQIFLLFPRFDFLIHITVTIIEFNKICMFSGLSTFVTTQFLAYSPTYGDFMFEIHLCWYKTHYRFSNLFSIIYVLLHPKIINTWLVSTRVLLSYFSPLFLLLRLLWYQDYYHNFLHLLL